MRLFLGVFPGSRVRDAVDRVVASLAEHPELGAGRGGPRWVAAGRRHLTVRFLGERPPDLVAPLLAAGRGPVGALPRFEVDLDGLGGFPSRRRARVLWVGVGRGHDRFAALAHTVASVLAGLGIEEEDRPFEPHMTLARASAAPLRVPAVDARIPGLAVQEVRLVHSLPGRGGGYDVLGRWALAGTG